MGFPSRLLSVAFDSLDQIPECGQGALRSLVRALRSLVQRFGSRRFWFVSTPPLPTLSPLSPPAPPKIPENFLRPPADSTGLGSIVKSIRKPYPVGTFFVQVKIHGFFKLL